MIHEILVESIHNNFKTWKVKCFAKQTSTFLQVEMILN
jgi:hypothetical protein